MNQNSAIIIGLGNPILGDDGVGWEVVKNLKYLFGDTPSLEFDCFSLGGLSLMEKLTGYQKVILVDALHSGKYPLGKVVSFPLSELQDDSYGHISSAHDTSLRNALNLGRNLGINLPKDENIIVIAIESKNVYDFSEELSPMVANAVPEAVNLAKELISLL